MIINDLFHSKKTTLAEFAPGSGGDDDHQDPYGAPKPEHYDRSIDFFGQFEADHFDEEDMNDATGEFKGYWYYDGKPRQIAYFKFDNPRRTGSNHPGVGWYYEPQNEGVAEGMSGKVVFSGTGADGSTYEIIQSGLDDYMIHANGKHIDTYSSLQRAMSVLQNEVPGLQQSMEEGWKSALGGAALAGSMALGGAAQAQSNNDYLPDMVAHVTFAVNGKTITKDYNLGSKYGSARAAAEAVTNMLKSKGIKYTDINIERVSGEQTANDYMDRSPAADQGMGNFADNRPLRSPVKSSGDDYMVKEVNLGDYRKKAQISQAGAKINRFFDRDDAAKVAAADQTIAKREKGLARADARTRPYTPPSFDSEKYQRDLTAKYPNIDELVAKAELNRDPDYEMADGQAYYAARDAEQNYQKLKQIQRVIQGLNESQADAKKKELSTGTGRINPDTGRPWTPSELKAKYSDVDFDKEAKKADLARMRDQAKQERLIDKLKTSLGDPRDTTSDLAKSFLNKGGLGLDFKPPGPRPTVPLAPEPVTVKGQPPGFTANNLAQQPGMAQYMQQKPITSKPVPNFAQGPAAYKTATTNVPPVATTTTAQTAEKNTSDILQALTKMGFKTKEAEAAINRLPPNISTKDAILQILRGKQMSESLTWSRNFDPGRSLYRRIKQES